jgi:transposase
MFRLHRSIIVCFTVSTLLEGLIMVRRYGLRGEQWEQSKHVLPGRAETVGGTAKDNRLFVEAVISRSRAGIPWRDLPERFGDWKNIHRRHRRWSESGVWQRVLEHLAGAADNAYALIDSTIVRVHQHAAGAKGGTKRRRASAVQKAD